MDKFSSKIFIFSDGNYMKMSLIRNIFILLIPLLAVNLYATVTEAGWLFQATQLLFVSGLAAIYLRLRRKVGLNAMFFFVFLIFAIISGFFFNTSGLSIFSLLLYTVAYFGLSREALQHTERETPSKRIFIFFLFLICMNTYLLFTHVIELKSYMQSESDFIIYIANYSILLILGIIALIYYLNSYSKKSIYFVTLVLTLIFSSIFRDASNYYMKDSVILITGNLLWYTALIFSLLFFITSERKLRLMNLF